MIIREIEAKAILSKSKIHEYTLNAYVGCEHDCLYCYARFMKRFTGHREPWGQFVDAKINAVELLRGEVGRKKPGTVWISGVCDAYQPLEEKVRLTGQCLEILVDQGWPVAVQTKSPLVLRDIGILRRARNVRVGFTVTTADDRVRRIFEPGAPAIQERIAALGTLHAAGIRTFVMVAPLLPGAEGLAELLKDRVDEALLDRDNYAHADWAYRKYDLLWAKDGRYLEQKGVELKAAFEEAGIPCRILY